MKRRDGTVLTADLLLYALTGDVKHNPYVLDGDVIRVPFQSLVATIAGAVNRPGRYELVGTLRPRRAGGARRRAHPGRHDRAARAGGAARARREARPPLLRLRRRGEAARRRHGARGQRLDPGLRRAAAVGDHHRALAGVAATAGTAGTTTAIAVAGADGNAATSASNEDGGSTRRLPFAQGDTVRSLLERVGGVGPLADLKGSYILRNGQAMPVDLYALVMLRDL